MKLRPTRPTKRLLEEISSYIDKHFVADEGFGADACFAASENFAASEGADFGASGGFGDLLGGLAEDESIGTFAADECLGVSAADEFPDELAASKPMSRASAPASTNHAASTPAAKSRIRAASAPAAKSSTASAPSFASRTASAPFAAAESIDKLLSQKEATFSETLLQEIDARNLRDPEVYKRANIDRKLFSKIRSNAQYQPKKQTAVALALALSMNLDDTLDLIGRAGYTLTASSKADLIVQYFIERKCWDINLINQVLYEFDQPLIGS